jgi:hypothetical protein
MSVFWASILLGAVFGFLGSVVANLIHNPLLVLVDRWRLSSRKKRFAREAAFHQFVSDLKSGKIDKYIFLVRICATMIMGFLGALICGVGGFLLSYLSERPDAMMLRFALGLSSGGLFSFYLLAAARYQAVAWGLGNFDKLDAEFKQKWAAGLNDDDDDTGA